MKVNIIKAMMLFLFLPRMAIVIPIYAVAAGLLSINSREILKRLAQASFTFVFFLSLLAISSFFYRVSLSAFLIEFVLILPLILLLFNPFKSVSRSTEFLKIANILALIFSLINITLNFGFPLKLPYINFLPDAIAAFWGNGGAKIVTCIGFFGLLSKITDRDDKQQNSLYIVVCLVNFISPSFNVGIVCGLMGLIALVVVKMKIKHLLYSFVFLTIFFIVVGPYILFRIETMNILFINEFGIHPKLYGYKNLLDIIIHDPLVALFGTGLGNFSGTSALWASEYISMISSHDRIDLPGLYESEIHNTYLAPALELVSIDRWSLSSTLNKPYSSITTILSEFGIVLGVYVLIRLIAVLRSPIFEPRFSLGMIIFTISFFSLDNMHSNSLFLGFYCIALRAGLKSSRSSNDKDNCK